MKHEKKFFKTEIADILTDWDEADGCIASDRIMVDGEKVGYMYREQSDNEYDSGWCFFAGDESDEYCENSDNFGLYKLNTVCNYDADIIPFLHADNATAFARNENGQFIEEAFEPPED